MKIVRSHRVFLNSEYPPSNSEARDLHVSVPQGIMACGPHEQLRVTLGSFVMRQNIYLINKYNNVFYLVARSNTGAITSGKVTIPQGNYQSWSHPKNGLIKALTDAIDTVVKAAPFGVTDPNPTTITYNSVTGILSITINTTGAAAGLLDSMKMVSFTIRDYNASAGSLIQTIIGSDFLSAFVDTQEILGGCPEVRNELTGTVS